MSFSCLLHTIHALMYTDGYPPQFSILEITCSLIFSFSPEGLCDFCLLPSSCLQICRSAGVPMVINDRIDIALALGPDVGVHIGQDDMPAADARRLMGPSRILGVSVKTVQQAQKAAHDGADYVGCGAVYSTNTKSTDVIGLEPLAEVCRLASVPVVAIGGLSAANADTAIAAGADGVAVVSALFAAADGTAATAELVKIVESALKQRTGNHSSLGQNVPK